jgi:SPP1 family predicted phage head-tail adaptor
MRAGELRHRITIEEQVITRDIYGDEVAMWARLGEAWAAVEDESGAERFVTAAGEQRVAERLTRIRLRHRSDLTPKMRIAHNSNYYNIERIERDPTLARQIVLLCSEVNPV